MFTSKRTFSLIPAALIACLSIVGQASAQERPLSLGSIEFANSGSPAAQEAFKTGVLALHSFWYPEARDHFRRARQLDPDFALAYWGEAMTHDHPLWEQHDQEAGEKIFAQMDQRKQLKWSNREKGFVDAVRMLYDDADPMQARRERYAKAMQQLSEKYPDDDEVAVFAALAEMSRPKFDFENPHDVVPVAAVLEEIYQRNRKHPGAMHYLIHVYDSDPFAELGLRPADDYASVAYSSSHAIHMPSHIYKRLKMWDKVIEANIRAYESSVKWQQRTGRPLRSRDYHSFRWLYEAYLETNQLESACDLLNELRNLHSAARNRDEDPGRIPSLIENFKRQYRRVAENRSVQCLSAND